MVICGKKQRQCLPNELEAGDCWIALSLAQLNGLVLCGRVGKRTDSLAQAIVASTEGKTDCKEWHTDGWAGYERVLRDREVEHYIGKILTQRLERTNGCLRQQTGRWHRRQNKFALVVGADESHLAFGHHLLQLDLGTFPFRHYGSSTCRPNGRTLGLVRYCCLFHTLLTHNPPLGSAVLLRNLMKAGRIFSCRLSIFGFEYNHHVVGVSHRFVYFLYSV